MFIPRFWSDATHREDFPHRRQVTVRRFGWSSESQDAADLHAKERLEEALRVVRAEGPEGLREFRRRERKIAYSGPDGLPIREEILNEHPECDVVITRNSYGAACLNTREAMFVDVDRRPTPSLLFGCLGLLLGAVGGYFAHPSVGVHWGIAVGAGAIVGNIVALELAKLLALFRLQSRDPVQWAVRRVRLWCDENRDWLVAVYETPAGARVLPLHKPFEAGDEDSREFMEFLRADELYVRLCLIQKCFRARVSPKPWRVGMPSGFPAGGTWPIHETENLARRADWVRDYMRRSEGYASCRLRETMGRGMRDARVEKVQKLHDELGRVNSHLPLA